MKQPQRTLKAMKRVILQRYNDMIMSKQDIQLSKQTQKIIRKTTDEGHPITKSDLERL